MAKLFGTDGVRGRVFQELSPLLALRLGMAIASYFGEGSVILVGRDSRAGGDAILKAVVAGLLSGGVRVRIVSGGGFAPTPAIQYATKSLGYDGAVVVTASHNPPEYNGIKVIGPLGVEIGREAEKRIEEAYFSERFRLVPWSRAIYDAGVEDRVIDSYVDAVVDNIDVGLVRRRGFRVLVDCANNVSSLTTPSILRRLGAKPYTLACELSPLPYREPEPTPSSLIEAGTIVKALGLDLGVGHDGDGDRAILIDEQGEVWWGDRTAALLSPYVADHKLRDAPRRVVTAVSTSSIASQYLEEHGLRVEWTPVGSINISYMLLEKGGVAGFEENGGFIYPPHLLARDGGMTIALFLEMMARENMKASQLYARLPRYHAIKTKIPMGREKAMKVVEHLREKYEGKGLRLVTVDGIRVEGDDYWFLVRPSGTEPVLRIMVEARSLEKARLLAEKLAEEARRIQA
ncbi:MAG: phosphoglucosamine mutase [Hyperthermus sp.]|nr:MAG: phosphoglucosamine mutase [Hyperthermus sp.]